MAHHLSISGHHFLRGGVPLFLAIDTAWNVVAKGNESEWEHYLMKRREQGFNACAFVCGPWLGSPADDRTNLYLSENGRASLGEPAAERLDAFFEICDSHGMIPIPVLFWARQPDDIGRTASSEELEAWATSAIQRWGVQNRIWIPFGDCFLTEWPKWSLVGARVKREFPDAILGVHPVGRSFYSELQLKEKWLDIAFVQSGHDTNDSAEWLTTQGFSTGWQRVRKPFCNLEPAYEGMFSTSGEAVPTETLVENWLASLFAAPLSGLAFGNNAVWSWAEAAGPIHGHPGIFAQDCWKTALSSAGAEAFISVVREMTRDEWWQFKPEPPMGVEPSPRRLVREGGECLEWIESQPL